MTTNKIKAYLAQIPANSAWKRGVKAYAADLLDAIDDCDLTIDNAKVKLLNGASDWEEYSYSGCTLIYDADIAKRLCTKSELKRTHNGERNPNGLETWIDTQARALEQAAELIVLTIKAF